MFIRELKDCEEFIAGDNCTLREILHPDKDKIALRYSLAHAVVKPGETTWPHRLKNLGSLLYYCGRGYHAYRRQLCTGSVELHHIYTAPGQAEHHEFRNNRSHVHLSC
jgi:hypothetical protein